MSEYREGDWVKVGVKWLRVDSKDGAKLFNDRFQIVTSHITAHRPVGGPFKVGDEAVYFREDQAPVVVSDVSSEGHLEVVGATGKSKWWGSGNFTLHRPVEAIEAERKPACTHSPEACRNSADAHEQLYEALVSIGMPEGLSIDRQVQFITSFRKDFRGPFQWIRRLFGFRCCGEWGPWKQKTAQFTRPVTMHDLGALAHGKKKIEFTRTWQERTCTKCGRKQQEVLDY